MTGRLSKPYPPLENDVVSALAKSRALKQVVYIQAPPAKVFKFIAEPRGLKRWILASGKITPKKGGNYAFTWQGGYSHSGKVLDYVRDQRLSLLWPHRSGEDLLGNTRVTFRLKPKEEGTLLEMTHAGFKSGAAWGKEYDGTNSGWAYYLTNLKSVVQHNKDLRSPLDNI